MLKGTANSIQKSFDYEWCSWNCDFAISQVSLRITLTPDSWQSKLLLTIDEHGPNITRNMVFDWQMTIENPVSSCFWSTFVDSIKVFDCRLSGVTLKLEMTPIFQKQSQKEYFNPKWKKIQSLFAFLRPPILNRMLFQWVSLFNRRVRIWLFGRRVKAQIKKKHF